MPGNDETGDVRSVEPGQVRELLTSFLYRGLTQVCISIQVAGVDLPANVSQVSPGYVALNLSWNFGVPLELDDWGVHTDLSFNGTWYSCSFPWASVVFARSLAAEKSVKRKHCLRVVQEDE